MYVCMLIYVCVYFGAGLSEHSMFFQALRGAFRLSHHRKELAEEFTHVLDMVETSYMEERSRYVCRAYARGMRACACAFLRGMCAFVRACVRVCACMCACVRTCMRVPLAF